MRFRFHWTPLLFGIVAGLSYFASYSPNRWWWASFFISFCILGIAATSKTWKQALFSGWLAGFVAAFAGYRWVIHVATEFGELPYPISVLVHVLFSSVAELHFAGFTLIVFLLRKRWNFFPNPLAASSLYVLFEMFFPKIFPDALGYSLHAAHFFHGPLDLFGLYFLSFFVFFTGALLWDITQKKSSNLPFSKFSVTSYVVVLIFMISYTQYRHHQLRSTPVKTVEVAMIQANIGNLQRIAVERGYRAAIYESLDRHRELSQQALQLHPNIEIIVWPESAFPLSFANSTHRNNASTLAQNWGVTFITGGYDSIIEAGREKDTNSLYTFFPEHQKNEHGWYDQPYHKVHLLAFGEYFPLSDRFPFLMDLVPNISDFGSGKKPVLHRFNNFEFAPVICYETILPSFVQSAVKRGASFMVNVTNDSWFGPHLQPFQHLHMSAFRSIEHRIPMIRSTNTGISALIDWRGKITTAGGLFTEEFIHGSIDIPLDAKPTLYTRAGNLPLIIFSVLILLGTLIHWRRLPPTK